MQVLRARCLLGCVLPVPVYRPTTKENRGALRVDPSPAGKPEAFWCRGLFLGVEGEGTGKKDRELGRWGQEAGERVFPPAISLARGTSPSQTSLPLACEPRATTGNPLTHPRRCSLRPPWEGTVLSQRGGGWARS